MLKLPRIALLVIAAVTVLRIVAAFRIPLTGDETYYWSWSKHLAFGYIDHPPAVAYLIALMSPFGQSSGVVRLPFIACEALAALALGRTAFLLSGNAVAGAIAAIAFTLIPQTKLAIGEALPDGPYVLCWALTLMLAAQALMRPVPRTMVLLGFALGGAILSRFFGWALVGGILAFTLAPERRSAWKSGFWLALAIAVTLYLPFLVWNATHGWQNIAFTVHDRHTFQVLALDHSSVFAMTRFLLYAAAFWIVGFVVAIRPGYPLIAWTALPFPTVLAVLSIFVVVEPYWLLGPVTSLCVGIGIAVARLSSAWRWRVGIAASVPAACTIAAALFLALPEAGQGALLQAAGGAAKGPLYSSVFLYRSLSDDVRALTAAESAVATTNRLEIAGELYYHGLRPIMVGASPQVDQWNQWRDVRQDATPPPRALIVTFSPLAQDRRLARQVERAYRNVSSGPVLRYQFADTTAGTFYTTWCSGPRTNASDLYGVKMPSRRFDGNV